MQSRENGRGLDISKPIRKSMTVDTLVDWFRTSHSPETKQFLVENLSYMLRVSLPETMKRAASLDDFRETAL